MARITLRQLLDHAAEHGYGVPAFNINNMEQGLAVMEAAKDVDSPVILQASRGARSYAGDIMLGRIIDALKSRDAVRLRQELDSHFEISGRVYAELGAHRAVNMTPIK